MAYVVTISTNDRDLPASPILPYEAAVEAAHRMFAYAERLGFSRVEVHVVAVEERD